MTSNEYWNITKEARSIYNRAKNNNLCNVGRRERGISHHPKSIELMKFLENHDLNDYDDYFCWKVSKKL